ncbi:MAG: hypothetical protein PHF63_06925 [Herbinix sp.]|nr:hypothetical protein [Herbinix sp.]
MKDQEEVRNRYMRFLNETGTNQKFLCNKLGINESTMSRWRNNKLYLPRYDLVSIEDYISTKGF